MSKQIRFFHTEEDIYHFISYLDSKGGKVCQNGLLLNTKNLSEIIIHEMRSNFSRYLIIYNAPPTGEMSSIDEGTAIEFLNCVHKNGKDSEYSIGRLYLRQAETGSYITELEKLYSQLVYYFRKEYVYSKPCHAYFSKDFLAKSEAGSIVGRSVGNTIMHFDRVVIPHKPIRNKF